MALPTSQQEQEECRCFHKKIFSPHPKETVCSERCYLLGCKNVLVPSTQMHRSMSQTEDKNHFPRARAAPSDPGTPLLGHLCRDPLQDIPFVPHPWVLFPGVERMVPDSLFFPHPPLKTGLDTQI